MASHLDLELLAQDDTLEEIWVNSPSKVFISRNGVSEQVPLEISSEDVALWVERMLLDSNRRLDMSQPFVDATLKDGSRLHVVIPDIVQKSWSVNVRKHLKKFKSLSDLVAEEVLSQLDAEFLSSSISQGKSVIVAGGTGAGKTTLLNCLLNEVDPAERVITCEEVFEISLNQSDWVAMQTRPGSIEGNGEVTLRHLVREALRMRPERLVIGEVRQAECFDLLLALNSGQPGMATIHANSSREAILKLCTLPLLAGSNVTAGFVVPMVANAVDVIVHIARAKNGKRKVTSISELTGKVVEGLPEIVTRTMNTNLLKVS
ncbi:MAG: ATPase, T2SS/T4P/T4SS family [Actinobacteria bacterium]|nr:ATPase, T2SS/T4P/T4SS family [Actinomycetota bacterium]